MKGTLPRRVRLGVFEVDLRAGELRQDEGAVLVLSDQPLLILRILIEADGEIVSRDEIRQRLWPDDTIVEFDHSINNAIKKLRRALVDSGDEPHYIGTIAKRGYRLLVPVERIGTDDDAGDSRGTADPSAPSAADSARDDKGGIQAVAADLAAAAQTAPVIPVLDESSKHPTFARSGTHSRWKWLAVAVVVCMAILAGVLYWRFKGQPVVPRKTLSERLLTHNPSENPVENAAISPDGTYVAYADNKGLHLSVIETGESHDLPLPEELRTHLWAVTWFPDGEKLILTSDSDAEGKMIWTISVFGGLPHKVGSGGNWPTPVASPQGSSIAFIGRHDREIWVMGANGENPHKILAGKNERYGALAWSPTGQRLAYIRTAEGQAGGSIETLSLDGGPPSEVISDPQLVNAAPGLVWARDGRMIFLKGEGSLPDSTNLWEIMIDPLGGKPSAKASKITNWDGLFTYSPTISRDAHRLGVMKTHIREDIYVGELQDGGTRLASPKRLTVSESLDLASGWMHDGKTILFESNRTGRSQVFRQPMEQGAPERLIMGPDDEEGAELSPDGLWFLYWSSSPRGDSPAMIKRLMRFPAVGGHPEQVLEVKDPDAAFDCPIRPSSSCVISHWDRGQLIFYALDAIRGQGKELAKTELGSSKNLDWSASPEGLRIGLLIKDQSPEQVRILDLQNGVERNLPLPHEWRVWSLSWPADGNAVFAAARSTTYFIARIELDGKTQVLLNGNINQEIDSPYPSPDGRHLVFSQRTAESKAWLLEDF